MESWIPVEPRRFEDVEALWSKVDFRLHGGAGMKAGNLKEKCWYAAYDAPFHGVPYSPYMVGPRHII